MKIKNLCLFFLTLCLGTASAQDKPEPETHKGYIGITFGPAYPVGDFGDHTFQNDRSGMAIRGYQYSIAEFGVKFIPNFGMVAAIKGAVIPLDVEALANGYAETNGGQFVVKSTRWGYTFLAGGPMISIPTKAVDIDFRFMTGIMIAVSPQLTIIWDGVNVAGQDAGSGGAFGFSVGADLRIHLSQRFSLMVIGDYITARPTFETTYDQGNGPQTGSFEQSFTLFGLSGGIAYRIF